MTRPAIRRMGLLFLLGACVPSVCDLLLTSHLLLLTSYFSLQFSIHRFEPNTSSIRFSSTASAPGALPQPWSCSIRLVRRPRVTELIAAAGR